MSPDPLPTTLAKFTPDASCLDHDALLFAAGRAAAQPSHWWRTLAGMLVLTQLTTLLVISWPRSEKASSEPDHPTIAASQLSSVEVVQREVPLNQRSSFRESNSLWVLRKAVLETGDDLPLLPYERELSPPSPPLLGFDRPKQRM